MIPRVTAGPWSIKKMVGSTPIMVGQKTPVSYFGSKEENYLEICVDVTGSSKFSQSICNAVTSKSSAVTLDVGFVIEGKNDQVELPERLLCLFRLHHILMERVPTILHWRKKLEQR